MNKKDACVKLIQEISQATTMDHRIYDAEKREATIIREDIPEGTKETVISYLIEFANSEQDVYTVYHGQGEKEDYIYRFEFDKGNIHFVRDIDSGRHFHHYYSDPGEILYGVAHLEDAKSKTTSIPVQGK